MNVGNSTVHYHVLVDIDCLHEDFSMIITLLEYFTYILCPIIFAFNFTVLVMNLYMEIIQR